MSNEKVEALIVLGVFLLACLVFALNLVVTSHYKQSVKKHSTSIYMLQSLNDKTMFYSLQMQYTKVYHCNSLKEFKRLSVDDYFYVLINESPQYYKEIIDQAFENSLRFKYYADAVRLITSDASKDFCKSIHVPYSFFVKYENKVFSQMIKNAPVCEPTIKCRIYYITPAGRNIHTNEKTFSFSNLQATYDLVIKKSKETETQESFIARERAMMTNNLRYEIMRRDGFRCQLCGATAKDGVKLHIDHIIPVSKGGKTIPENLRTLCDRCNIGKSDKIE